MMTYFAYASHFELPFARVLLKYILDIEMGIYSIYPANVFNLVHAILLLFDQDLILLSIFAIYIRKNLILYPTWKKKGVYSFSSVRPFSATIHYSHFKLGIVLG